LADLRHNAVVGVPSGRQWSKVDKEVSDVLSVDDGGDDGVGEDDYSPRDDARRLQLTVHGAASQHDDETETDNDLELIESELWRMINARQLGMTDWSILLGVSC